MSGQYSGIVRQEVGVCQTTAMRGIVLGGQTTNGTSKYCKAHSSMYLTRLGMIL
jgi:hypothetical protein